LNIPFTASQVVKRTLLSNDTTRQSDDIICGGEMSIDEEEFKIACLAAEEKA
jgi:hypothetical protein